MRHDIASGYPAIGNLEPITMILTAPTTLAHFFFGRELSSALLPVLSPCCRISPSSSCQCLQTRLRLPGLRICFFLLQAEFCVTANLPRRSYRELEIHATPKAESATHVQGCSKTSRARFPFRPQARDHDHEKKHAYAGTTWPMATYTAIIWANGRVHLLSQLERAGFRLSR